MEALHAGAELEHDETAWEHIWPEDWETMWSPAERKESADGVVAELWILCEVLTSRQPRQQSLPATAGSKSLNFGIHNTV